MDVANRFGLLCILILYTAHIVASLTLVGHIHMNGINGTVVLTQTDGDTSLVVDIDGLQNENSWTIREVHMLYDVTHDSKCSDDQLGPRLGTYAGTIPSDGTVTTVITKSDLDDLSTLTGRSILLSDQTSQNSRVCASLEEDSEHKTAVGILPTVIGGHVTLRQSTSSMSAAVSLFTDLYHVTDTDSSSESDVMIQVFAGPLAADDSVVDMSKRCGNIGAKEHDLGTVSVGVTKGGARRGLVLNNVSLQSANNVLRKVLGVVAPNGSVISCATIREIKPRVARTLISRDGVEGQIKFMQASPYDVTHVMLELSGLRGLASGYHVHKWPVPQKLDSAEAVCDAGHVSGHFNPFDVNSGSSPGAGTGTNDQYEIGDLSGKYGLLNNLNDINATYSDRNLPLYGVNSILGRSIVIHKAFQGFRWVCANIDLMGEMKVASIKFTYPVIGYMVFKQPMNNWHYTDTQIYVSLSYGDGTTTSTNNHKWHVHQEKVGDDFDAASSRCISVKGHYNPYMVDLSGNYATNCSSNNPLRCEVGDLAGKHGPLTVRSVSGMQHAFYTDVDLPLSGPLSIVGKSVVIHDADNGSGRLACADIEYIPARKVKVSKWYQNSASAISGSVTLSGNAQGSTSTITKTEFDLQNLASESNGCHVHKYPVNETSPGAAPCGASSVGGHFVPYGWNIANSPANGTGTDDQYEVGDLSGRYGSPLYGQTAYQGQFYDTIVALRGPLSVVGRSIVIHKSDNTASRWVCGNIEEDSSSTGTLYQSKATFAEGDIQGEIVLRQYYYKSGASSDTEVIVNLQYAANQSATTPQHNWHVHEKQVTSDATSGCLSPAGHYNPFHVNVSNGYSECSFSNPLRCELGDQAGKMGRYDIGGGSRFYTDVNLPIMGRFGVTGRSFVIHGQNGAGARVACANIMPVGMPSVQMSFPLTKNFDKDDLQSVIAAALGTDTWNIMTQQSSVSTTTSDCMQATVIMMSTDGAKMKRELEYLLQSKSSVLGKYSPCSAASSLMSSIVVLVSVLLLRNSIV